MYCERCGKQIIDESIFCEHCGYKVMGTDGGENADESENTYDNPIMNEVEGAATVINESIFTDSAETTTPSRTLLSEIATATGKSTPKEVGVCRVILIIQILLNTVVAISPFLNMCVINAFEKMEFSLINMFNIVNNLKGILNIAGKAVNFLSGNDISKLFSSGYFLIILSIVLGYIFFFCSIVFLIIGNPDTTRGAYGKRAILRCLCR